VQSFQPTFLPEGAADNLSLGPDGNMWFVDTRPTGRHVNYSYIGYFAIPLTPAPAGTPEITGSAVAGQVLAASVGSWTHEPTSFAYQWQTCDSLGANCKDLPGERTSTHLLSNQDAGDTMRVIVSASNVAGDAQAISEPSRVVQSRPASPPSRSAPSTSERLPAVGAAVTWRFSWSPKYTTVRALIVHGLTADDVVRASCIGRGCSLARRSRSPYRGDCHRDQCVTTHKTGHSTEVNIAGMFDGMRLKPGATISVIVSSPQLFGKSLAFHMRSGASPRIVTTCLSPGSFTVRSSC
jgi:hypothetical protein